MKLTEASELFDVEKFVGLYSFEKFAVKKEYHDYIMRYIIPDKITCHKSSKSREPIIYRKEDKMRGILMPQMF